ncbi:MAG: alpha/beta hydrolase [Candidatus Lokiarchaeota archaeon]|nr:alpha/beta hydrolase [Candidatus Lokiarchaeota archaeon]
MESIEEKYIEVNGVMLHTIIAGSGESLILLHGFPDFWYGWNNVIEGLKEDFKLIVPDTRGINLSDKPEGEENYEIDILANDIIELSKKLNLGKFTLVGHDWGGVISYYIAYKYPEYIKKLIICNSSHPAIHREKMKTDDKQRRSGGYLAQLMKPGAEESFFRNDMLALKGSVFGTSRRKNAFTEEDKQKYIESWSQPNSILNGINYYRANKYVSKQIGSIEVPTLVIHGMKDNFIRPITLEGLSDYVKDLKIVKAEKSSHWVMHDAPEIVCSSIREFINP